MIAPRHEVTGTALATHGGRSEVHVAPERDFSVCLNAYGPASVVRDAVRESLLHGYPDPAARAPRMAASVAWNRPLEEIAFGAGSAEFIFAVCFAYLRPGDMVLIDAPAFGEYARASALCGATPRFVLPDARCARDARFDHLIAELARVRPRLVFCAAPSSPDGAAVERVALRALADACAAADALLVLDQAYDAFAAQPLGTPALPGHPAVLHLRSLTKEHALAGIRAAFAIAPAHVIAALTQVRVPWSASAPAQAAAVATFTSAAQQHAAATTAELRAESVRIAAALTKLGREVRSSTTHFFIAHVGDASRIQAALLTGFGLLVRDCTGFGLPEWIRLAARRPAENDVLINALTTHFRHTPR
jgi:histidinol-phosphate/aromatic aminotransferase/cobyric acid decarboxylase-like protein